MKTISSMTSRRPGADGRHLGLVDEGWQSHWHRPDGSGDDEAAETGRPLLILLADDDELVRSVVRLTLEDESYEFLEAKDGLEALELCSRYRPDLAILDWRMPGATGVEVIERLRRDEATARIPTILLTANGEPSQIQHGCEVGARAFLVKPFSPLELVRTVEAVFGSG